MFWPQWQARRRRQRQMAELRVGDEVMTVGGIIGKLTYFNADENRARIEIAPEVEIRVVVAAISRPLTSRDA
jgi:preprotein translocase subunit YajC